MKERLTSENESPPAFKVRRTRWGALAPRAHTLLSQGALLNLIQHIMSKREKEITSPGTVMDCLIKASRARHRTARFSSPMTESRRASSPSSTTWSNTASGAGVPPPARVARNRDDVDPSGWEARRDQKARRRGKRARADGTLEVLPIPKGPAGPTLLNSAQPTPKAPRTLTAPEAGLLDDPLSPIAVPVGHLSLPCASPAEPEPPGVDDPPEPGAAIAPAAHTEGPDRAGGEEGERRPVAPTESERATGLRSDLANEAAQVEDGPVPRVCDHGCASPSPPQRQRWGGRRTRDRELPQG